MSNLKARLISYKQQKIEFKDLLIILFPTIKTVCKKYSFAIPEDELVSVLWQILNSINPDLFENNNALISYIYKSLSNHCKNTLYNDSKLNIVYNSEITNIALDKKPSDDLLDSSLIFRDMTKDLSSTQKKIVDLKFNCSYTEAEIARILKISRQAVYKSNGKALNKLKEKRKHFLN